MLSRLCPGKTCPLFLAILFYGNQSTVPLTMHDRSGPAHFFFVIESMVAAAESMGLPREAAEPLVIQSCLGAGYLASASSKSVADLRKEVCVPGGSTEKAISHLDQNGVQTLFKVAIQKSLDANLKMQFC